MPRAVLVSARSLDVGAAVVVTVELLFDDTGSVSLEPCGRTSFTPAVLAIVVPGATNALRYRTIVKVWLACAARTPDSGQVRVVVPLQAMLERRNVVPAGSVSVTVGGNSVSLGPLFVTVIV